MLKDVSPKKRPLTTDEIYDRTSMGYDIFRYYCKEVKREMPRPWGKRETKPSFGIFPYEGMWLWKDFGSEKSGDAIRMVEIWFNLSFKEAIEKITHDLLLGEADQVAVTSPVVTWAAPTIEEQQEYSKISFSIQPWAEGHKRYWEGTGADERHCERYQCFAVKDAALNHQRIPIGPKEVVFGYYCPEHDSCKLYFPERKERRFLTNTPGRHLWNQQALQATAPHQRVFIQKSNKDLICLAVLCPAVIAPQSENAKLFDPEVYPEVSRSVEALGGEVVLFFGNDLDAKTKAGKIHQLHPNWKDFTVPNEANRAINDVYSYEKEYGVSAFEYLLRNNGYL